MTGKAKRVTPSVRQFVERAFRALVREAAKTERDDWSQLGATGDIERARYVQGMRDAATMLRALPTKPGRKGKK
jgi:hypothetical protein